MRILKSAVVAGMAVAGLIIGGASAIAEPASVSNPAKSGFAVVQDCGFWENHATAFYTHCADNCIWIVVDYASGPNRYKQIRQRGTFDIGGARDVDNAWYSHVC